VPRTRLIVDPGLGFAKAPPVSIAILGRLRELRARLGLPMLIGSSRKGFIGAVLGQQVQDRLAGSLPEGILAVAESGIRTHADLERLAQAGYHAFLVGERLIVQPDPGSALRELVQA
jgi:dihydropteroate synthase